MTSLFEPLAFLHGPTLANRFVLAPLTNQQSHPDGTLSEEEFIWLTRRAQGGFGLTMTCAAHVQRVGQGFPGQLGVFSDAHLPGLTRLAAAIRAEGSVAALQLHHAGMRSPQALIGEAPLCPSDDEKTGARAMTEAEVEQLIEDFIAAAQRAQKAGFQSVEVHGAHGYIVCQFLSSEINQRTDRFGGSLENRARVVFSIVRGIRERCGPDMLLGLRLSPERFGMKLDEVREVAQTLMREEAIDYLDMSLWDVRKEPTDEAFKGRSLMSYFTDLERGAVRLGVAGKVSTAAEAQYCLDAGVDFVLLGKGAILHADFPEQARANARFEQAPLPVSADYLSAQGLSDPFVTYMKGAFAGFVAAE
ncbi:NADH:flavin oxidoreductase [Phenylobacterium sp.]|uniref:NADH:flavin oxidoreductase n=1 Tax=Phenylobacterium sp. TaxID=1871053 RepID=UPI0027373BCD|nr:NADH:flavin oxidoreductase [Phenylobacterium sp.]MDP3660172.1 NADH:flavin oxidoreductase [Phenylobacterium sp.]